jgi:hypothetical protein
MEAAKATAERTALVVLEISPVTNASALRDPVAIIANYFE